LETDIYVDMDTDNVQRSSSQSGVSIAGPRHPFPDGLTLS
jgi:hypothetical protein